MNGKWFNFYKKQGKVAKQAHIGFPENTYEREMGKEGFFGPVTHFYHQNKHTGWTDFQGDNRPRAFDTNLFGSGHETPWDADVLMAYDADFFDLAIRHRKQEEEQGEQE